MEISISSLSTNFSVPAFQKPAISSSKSSFLVNHSFRRSINGDRLGLDRARPTNPAQKKGFCCNSLFGLGVPELAVIAGVAALVFGPKQIPEIGRSIGRTVKGFQQAAKEFEAELKKPEETLAANEAIEAKPVTGSSEEKENASASASKDS